VLIGVATFSECYTDEVAQLCAIVILNSQRIIKSAISATQSLSNKLIAKVKLC
jgi:hypothetical protein